MDEEDQKLIEHYFQGNREAFDLLVRKYSSPLYGFILTLLKDRDTAEDVVQTTFIKAWKNLKSFDRERSFKTWLFTIAKNTAYDFLKKKKTIPFSLFLDQTGESPIENIPDETQVVERLLGQQDDAKKIVRALAELPEQYRTVLELIYREDFTLLEIASIMGVAYNTVKSHHFRAIRVLRKILAGDATEQANLS